MASDDASPGTYHHRLASEDPNPGYHFKKIHKGKLGEPSKIQEELDELNDALEQGNRILALCELADLYGALEAVAEKLGASMPDIKRMAEATKRAFQSGQRK